jgi:hypothetical protein
MPMSHVQQQQQPELCGLFHCAVEIRVARLEERLDAHDEWKTSVSNDLKSINSWLRGVMGALIISLVLLVINLAIGHETRTTSSAQSPPAVASSVHP